ncbi:MAG: glycosyltransferase family 2 protein [Candidatus Hadarchaeales archaeon]
MKVSVIIPAYNEEGRIGRVVEGARKVLPWAEILVVDGGSEDDTVEEARKAGARVVGAVRGKGLALKRGAEEAKGEILLFLDGDGSYPPTSLPYLLYPLLSGRAELVRGSRLLGKSNFSPFRKLGNKLLSRLASLLYSNTSDLLTGMFAMRKKDFLSLGLKSRGFEVETELFVKAVRKGLRIGEVPISYRRTGKSKLSPLLDGIKIFFTLLRGSS